MQKSSINELDTLARGALTERFNMELERVLQNIYDPNTSATKVRKVVLELKIKPNDRRTAAEMSLAARSTLAPTESITTDILMKMDYSTGRVTATEITEELPGQIGFEGEVTEPTMAELN